MSRSLGVTSLEEICSFTFAMSFGCTMSNNDCPKRSFYETKSVQCSGGWLGKSQAKPSNLWKNL